MREPYDVHHPHLGVGWAVGGPWASGNSLCVSFIQMFPQPARVSLRHICMHKGTHADFTVHSSLEFGDLPP